MKKVRPAQQRTTSTRVLLALCLLLPALAGGCPEFRDGVVDAIDSATRSVLIGNTECEVAVETAATGILSAALDLFFDQLRSEEPR